MRVSRTFLVSCFPSLSWKTRARRSSGQTSTSSSPSAGLNRGLKMEVRAVSSPLLSNRWSRLPKAREMLDFESWRGCCKLSNESLRKFVSDFDLLELDTPSLNTDCCLSAVEVKERLWASAVFGLSCTCPTSLQGTCRVVFVGERLPQLLESSFLGRLFTSRMYCRTLLWT